MRKLAIGCVLVLVVVSPRAQHRPAGRSRPPAVQELLTQFHVPGVSIAVIKNFQIDWANGYGVADAATGTAVTADTLFQAASIRKITTAAMTSMKAVQDWSVHARPGREHDPEILEVAWWRIDSETGRSRHAR